MAGVQSAGVKRLMEAEKEANALIQQARSAKSQRMKEAKVKAEKAVEQFKLDEEARFQQLLQQNQGSGDTDTKAINDDMETRLKDMEQRVAANSDEVVASLLESVKKVDISVHVNFTKQ
eukprot:m.352216 g.352216  ORF g.352216 m.352216 type:complete len:119 (-) comp16466_c0_seq1:2676-3032(-)